MGLNLAQALRLIGSHAARPEKPPRLALVGAGGKTAALFQIARQLPGPVIVTTTTHLSREQVLLGDRHFAIESPDALQTIEVEDLPQVVVVTGPDFDERRVSGLGEETLNRLVFLADSHQLPLLVEADGSGQRPLKAPADHEPALPAFVDQVLVSAGLAGLGKPLDVEWVHRPERFAALSGLLPGERVTQGALVSVLSSPDGGLKRMPVGARRVVLLNQADTPELQASASSIARRLLPAFHAVVVASLQPASGIEARLPGEGGKPAKPESHPPSRISAVYEPVAGVVLAAGGSSRMGQPKQLLPWHGEPLVRRVASVALAAGLSPVIVVTGAFSEEVRSALEGLPVTFEHNPLWETGQSSSMKAGVQRLPEETGAAIFLLADQPQVPVTLMRAMVALHAETLSPIVAPLVKGQRGNPVMFDRVTYPDLMLVQGDQGGRALFSRFPAAWQEWHDENLLLDIDTVRDYQRLIDLYE